MVTKENDREYEYSIQYFNKFQNIGYRLNDLTYCIWEHKIVTSLCPSVEKKELLEIMGKHVRICVFEELKK